MSSGYQDHPDSPPALKPRPSHPSRPLKHLKATRKVCGLCNKTNHCDSYQINWKRNDFEVLCLLIYEEFLYLMISVKFVPVTVVMLNTVLQNVANRVCFK